MKFVFDFSVDDFFYMVKGLGISVTLTLWSVILGTILGIIFGFIANCGNRSLMISSITGLTIKYSLSLEDNKLYTLSILL